MESQGIEPKSLENRPNIPSYLAEYFEAFWALSSRRSMGFSAENPISTADIVAYLRLYPTNNINLFMYLIGEMDSEYLTSKYSDKKTVSKSTSTKAITRND